MRRERGGHTRQPTARVHEAFLRLVHPESIRFESRAHFFGVASRAMRQILVDHARRRSAAKRGGGWERVTFDDGAAIAASPDADIVELDQALRRFESLDARAARIVELRVFAGMTVEACATALGVSKRTVDNDWSVARMWLARELGGGAPA
jgi:RNA polymerase sigma factor (TIGR02999 family)